MTVPSATVRFSVIVQQAGHPELFTPWQDPQTDRGFKRAMAEHRVMTVRQENVGTRKDFGLVGFFKEPNATYLVFPKSLATYEGKRVVGIKYDLLATAPPKGPLASVSAPRHRPQPAAAAQKKPPNRFRVVVRSTATLEIAKEVEADNTRTARERALEAVAVQALDFSEASRSQKVLRVEKLQD